MSVGTSPRTASAADARPPRPAAPSEAAAVWLVAEREIASKLRSKAFLISTAVLFILALAGIVIGGFVAQNQTGTPVAVTVDAVSLVPADDGLKITEVPDRAAAEKLVTEGTVDAAIVGDPSAEPFGFTIVADSSAPTSLMLQFAQVPTVELLNPEPTDEALRYLVAIGFGIVFLTAASLFGSTIAQSVVEEKQTRVVEILISAIRARTLLAGKVIGNTVLAMAQILVLAAIAIVGLTIIGQSGLLGALGAPILWFAVFFLFGFVLLAALFAAAAAMVSRQEDIGSTTFPLTILIMAPYFLVIFFNDNPVVLTIMSYVPFSAPVGMPMRLFLGEAQWWEPLISLAILIATCVGAILVGAKIYQNSLLRMGARVKLGEALRG
ncbi:ABC-2 type transport system permease protein [Microbacterium sp. cf046]|uniref:ABC transporter permease n=1 Tax=Microbacterium sp. cf046 TaxID=1761803 RepID=UPI0008F05BDB|nr:ABC transporter permease [Microbacterium sp. cf046]SFR86310.1 ABC-2 type transport system permease protein [Microbacterium sp. cf046]